MFATTLEEGELEELHPSIPIQMESMDIMESTLIDSRACLNVISSKLLE